MNFKKFLIRKYGCDAQAGRKGQSSIEYFILLTGIVLATTISTYIFWPPIRDSLQDGFFPDAAKRIEQADSAAPSYVMPSIFDPTELTVIDDTPPPPTDTTGLSEANGVPA